MMQKENFKRLLAAALAISMTWSGGLPGSGLSLVQATEAGEMDVEESTEEASDEETSPSSEEEVSESEETSEDEKSKTEDPEKEKSGTEENEEEVDVEDLDEEELLKEKKLLEEKEEEEELKLIANFDFENLSDNDDITGGGAKATGTYSVVDSYGESGKAISLSDSKKQFLNVTKENGDSLLKGCKSVSLSFDANVGRTGTDWLFYAAPNTNPQSSPEYYLGVANIGSKLTIEHFKNGRNGATTNTPLAINTWVHVDVVYTQDETIVYVDGEKKSSFSSDNKLEDILGETPITYIGKANWGSGEYCRAYLDNYKIYQGKLTDSDVADLYQAFLDKKVGQATAVDFSLNMGYVTEDIKLPSEYDGKKITWTSSDEAALTNDGKVTRGSKNKEVTLTATIDGEDKDFKVVVLSEGEDVVTYVSNNPAVGQDSGMKIAAGKFGSFTALHKNQPIMYTGLGSKAYQSPVVLRAADGKSFYMVAADGPSGNLIVYETKDLINYSNERLIETGSSASNIKDIDAVYDMTDERYEIYLKTNDGAYLVTSKDMVNFEKAILIEGYDFSEVKNATSDAVTANKLGLTKDEYDAVVEKFTNPYNTSISTIKNEDIKVDAMTSEEEFRELLDKYISKNTVKAEYSDGTKKEYSLRFTEDSIENVDLELPGTYTLEGVIGGSGNFTDAADPLVPERADPYVVYNKDDGYYYFTASYPMVGSGDKDGYDRIILRRAKTIAGLANAEEVAVWDENTSKSLGRFIWAPEMHKIGDSWYLVATAGLNTGNGTTFNIRPFMIKFEGNPKKDSMLDADKWGEPELVKPVSGDNVLNAMSLDMTYFEADGKHYLIWANETKNSQNPDGLSYLFIASIDPENPTQLTSKAKLLTKPEYAWELVRYKVNEGPGVFKKDGKVYMTFSASGTGSEYCVGLMYADENADLLDMDNWTKLPYPILTSSDFDDEVSGPGHNSFTYDENGNLVIVYHARESKTHATHTGDPLYDPCRNAYVKTVLFDEDGLPIFNLSSEDFIKDGEKFKVNVVVEGEEIKAEPVLQYDFNDGLTKNAIKDAS